MLYQVCVSWSHFQCLAFISFLFALQQHQSSSSVLDCRVEPSQAEPNRAESIINSSSRSSIHITFHKPSRVESNWGKRRRSSAGMMTNDRRSKRRAKREDGRGPFVSQSAAMKSFSLFSFPFSYFDFLFFFSYRKGDFNGGVVSYYVYRPPPPSPPRCWHWNRMYTLPPFQIFRPFLFLLVT